MGGDGFWNDQDAAQTVVEEVKRLKSSLSPVVAVESEFDDLEVMLELVLEDPTPEGQAEVDSLLDGLDQSMEALEFRVMLDGEYDQRDAFLSVQAGAGGTESCDWAEMLLRMYVRWGERAGFTVDIVDKLPGEEAGLKWATLKVSGDYAYGYLRAESGVHRLVRISPFDSQARRQTSFAAVEVMPDIDAAEAPDIRAEDYRMDTYRAGGAGGQHVNKTDSAVRLTHIETGIVVACQTERSQHKNKGSALKMLGAKLYAKAQADREAELAGLQGEKGDIGWGHQIRSYVLHPYQMVKDHRTNLEVGNTQSVLDGDIQQFIETYLRSRAGGAPEE